MPNKNSLTALLGMFLLVVLTANLVSALVVDANYVTMYAGEQKSVSLQIDNNENFDIEDVSVSLVLDKLPFSAVGSSEKDVDDLNEGDDDSVSFTLRASNDITPGDYNIPYVVKYKNADEDGINASLQKTGTFGLRVTAKTELSFTAETEKNVINEKGKVSLKIINSGLGEIRFVNVKINPQGFTLLSSNEEYIGTVASDDFETSSFDVIFNSGNANLNAQVTYKDFDNKEQTENVNIPLKVYTRDEALKLGIIQKSNTMLYSGIVVAAILIWFIYRKIRKARKNKNKIGGGK